MSNHSKEMNTRSDKLVGIRSLQWQRWAHIYEYLS